MKRLKQVLLKSKHNPHYLCFYVRNGVGKISPVNDLIAYDTQDHSLHLV